MTIDTQKLRQAAASVRAFLKPEYGREIAAAADIIEALEGQVAEYARMLEKQGAEAGARIDAQTAEIARLREAQAWRPIETAPKDGTVILLGSSDGAWIAKYDPVYPSGYRPENPWFSLMLNHDHMGRMPNAKPTHWMPLPAAPDALQETAHDR